MKELSIEQKAKAYDEAIKKAKSKIKNDTDHVLYEDDIIDIFPELYESEDERIKNEIIDYISTADDKELIPYESWIAWLEEQANHANFRNKIQIGDKVTKNEDGVLVNLSQLNRVAKKDEQKSTDMVEPKFQVGDWVTSKLTGSVYQITNCIETLSDYNYTITCGNWSGSISNGIINDNFHLWTIKDAKDGDILANDKSVFIYAKVLYSKPYAYCGVDKFGVFKDNCLKYDWSNSIDNIHPATKEQCELLFRKMQEAGYEWDKDKKELIKQMTDDEHKQYMLEHQVDTIYDMSFEEAQDYISKRGFDIPWNDGDVMVDERCITQTVANVLKWADRHPLILLDNKQEEYASGLIYQK